MVFILHGNSDIGAHVWSNTGYLICLRHLIRSRAVTNRIFFSEKTYLPSNVSTMTATVIYYVQWSSIIGSPLPYLKMDCFILHVFFIFLIYSFHISDYLLYWVSIYFNSEQKSWQKIQTSKKTTYFMPIFCIYVMIFVCLTIFLVVCLILSFFNSFAPVDRLFLFISDWLLRLINY